MVFRLRPDILLGVWVATTLAIAVSPSSRPLAEFAPAGESAWRVINDGVMGGLSQSRMRMTPDGTGVFEGRISLDHGGGFASARTLVGPVDLSAYEGLAIRVRGDGRRYRLRIRTDDRFDGVAYDAGFQTTGAGWEVSRVPFSAFAPTFRGRVLTDVEPLDPARVVQLGIMIADRQAGEFRLELDWVRAYRAESESAES